jgi:hypothetical protein
MQKAKLTSNNCEADRKFTVDSFTGISTATQVEGISMMSCVDDATAG